MGIPLHRPRFRTNSRAYDKEETHKLTIIAPRPANRSTRFAEFPLLLFAVPVEAELRHHRDRARTEEIHLVGWPYESLERERFQPGRCSRTPVANTPRSLLRWHHHLGQRRDTAKSPRTFGSEHWIYVRRVGGLNTLLAKVTGTPHAELDTRDTPEDHEEDTDGIEAQLTEGRLLEVPHHRNTTHTACPYAPTTEMKKAIRSGTTAAETSTFAPSRGGLAASQVPRHEECLSLLRYRQGSSMQRDTP